MTNCKECGQPTNVDAPPGDVICSECFSAIAAELCADITEDKNKD